MVAQAAATKIVANVFAASERVIVEMRLGENGDWTPMTRQRVVDQFGAIFTGRRLTNIE